ncbi:MAG: disulfide bond formation protein B [Pseudomonadota bacterium]|nr:disulfide bond formation protein B [Pseudomonadota bacterium]
MANKVKQFLLPISAAQSILICAAISASLYAGALWFQYVEGLMPCSMCLWQRWPHIIIVLLAVIALFLRMPRLVLTAITITAATSVILAGYHAGVEWQLWSGPGGCTSNLSKSGDLTSLTDSLLVTPVVRCDEIAWSFLGLSMAGWNSLFSLDIFLIALISLAHKKR